MSDIDKMSRKELIAEVQHCHTEQEQYEQQIVAARSLLQKYVQRVICHGFIRPHFHVECRECGVCREAGRREVHRPGCKYAAAMGGGEDDR